MWFDPWIKKIPWRKKWQSTPVLLPGQESHGQRNLAGYSPWGHKEADMTEHAHAHDTGYMTFLFITNIILNVVYILPL